jgi:hypothetical protein
MSEQLENPNGHGHNDPPVVISLIAQVVVDPTTI